MILLHPDPRLTRRSLEIPASAFNTPQLRELGSLLATELELLDNCDGLAATQVDVGAGQAWRMLSLRTAAGISILCNPRVRSHSGSDFNLETSASFFCIPEHMSCPRTLVVEYRKIDGTLREVPCGGGGARFVWQGAESLEGRTILDRMEDEQRRAFLERYESKRARFEKAMARGRA